MRGEGMTIAQRDNAIVLALACAGEEIDQDVRDNPCNQSLFYIMGLVNYINQPVMLPASV